MYILAEPSEYAFKKVGIQGKKFVTDLTKHAGFAIITTENGHETTIIEKECDFIYYVIAGTGYFEINGTREAFGKGNLIVIPMGSRFTYKGRAKFLLTTAPPFRPEQEVTL